VGQAVQQQFGTTRLGTTELSLWRRAQQIH